MIMVVAPHRSVVKTARPTKSDSDVAETDDVDTTSE
jgi:hypothetical protein